MHYERALGSAKETRSHIAVAVGCGFIEVDDVVDRELDHICAVMFKVAR